jgi:hypothetical protein
MIIPINFLDPGATGGGEGPGGRSGASLLRTFGLAVYPPPGRLSGGPDQFLALGLGPLGGLAKFPGYLAVQFQDLP